MIKCQDVWVQYTRTIGRTLKRATLDLFKSKGESVHFWGLREINFELRKGDVLGVVGVNGSGKTTLLKTLCGVLQPDRGQVQVNGRICPLLELGTGFEPELSGGENIYLNGTILGIKKKDIQKRFRDIVEFAELEDFIDTPLKHYSSGMKMRLGFAIAIQGDPEVLLVDEGLSVGDLAFQKKCVDAVLELKKKGITIVYVSHTMDSIQHMCSSAIWLHKGRMEAVGEVSEVVGGYLEASDKKEKEQMVTKWEKVQGTLASEQKPRGVEVKEVAFLDGNKRPARLYNPFDTMIVAIRFLARTKINNPIFGVAIHRMDGIHICGPNTRECGFSVESIEGEGTLELCIPSLKLLSGIYLVTVGIFDSAHVHSYDYRDRAFRFEVKHNSLKGQRGLVAMEYEWNFVPGETG
ncbi:MAG: ABC transporter ATP-binding protein [Nitrospinales bacterium]